MQAWERWGLGVCLALSISCAGDISFEALPGWLQPQAPLCEEDADCAIGYLCEAGFCQAGCLLRLDGSDTCEGGYVCRGIRPSGVGFCKLGPVEPCDETYNTCEEGYICDEEVCKLGCFAFDNDKDTCMHGYVCEGSSRAKPPPPEDVGLCRLGCYVRVEDSCGKGSGYTCVSAGNPDDSLGVCRPGCQMHVENSCGKGSGYVCVSTDEPNNPLGICRPGCLKDADCPGQPGQPGNLVCDTRFEGLGFCRPECRINTSGSGITTDNCSRGFVCEGDNNQTNNLGICRPGCRVGGGSCGPGFVCVGDGGSTQQGAPGICRVACTTSSGASQNGCGKNQHCIGVITQSNNAPGYCQDACVTPGTNTPCDKKEICVRISSSIPAVCRPGCGFDTDCLPGQHCSMGNRRCQNDA